MPLTPANVFTHDRIKRHPKELFLTSGTYKGTSPFPNMLPLPLYRFHDWLPDQNFYIARNRIEAVAYLVDLQLQANGQIWLDTQGLLAVFPAFRVHSPKIASLILELIPLEKFILPIVELF